MWTKQHCLLHFLDFLENSVDREKIKELPFGDPPTGKEVSVNKLMEEMKPIIVEKRESDFRDVSNLI